MYPRYTQDIPKICLIYALDMSEIYLVKSVKGL